MSMGDTEKYEEFTKISEICELLLQIYQEPLWSCMTCYRPYLKQRFKFLLGSTASDSIAAVEGSIYFNSDPETL
jgi:hypothetical protein